MRSQRCSSAVTSRHVHSPLLSLVDLVAVPGSPAVESGVSPSKGRDAAPFWLEGFLGSLPAARSENSRQGETPRADAPRL